MAIEVNENLASKLQEALQEKTVAVNQFKNADTLLAEVVAEKQSLTNASEELKMQMSQVSIKLHTMS